MLAARRLIGPPFPHLQTLFIDDDIRKSSDPDRNIRIGSDKEAFVRLFIALAMYGLRDSWSRKVDPTIDIHTEQAFTPEHNIKRSKPADPEDCSGEDDMERYIFGYTGVARIV